MAFWHRPDAILFRSKVFDYRPKDIRGLRFRDDQQALEFALRFPLPREQVNPFLEPLQPLEIDSPPLSAPHTSPSHRPGQKV